jgi:hypothetical protein
MTDLVISEGVTHIAENAFFCCQSLQRVSLPATLSVMAPSAFDQCPQAVFSVPAGSKAEQLCQTLGLNYETRVAE